MNGLMSPAEHQVDQIPEAEPATDEYTPLLLAFGPADHAYESEGSEDAEAYIVGYN